MKTISRRHFIQSSALILGTPFMGLGLLGCNQKSGSSGWFISGSDNHQGQHHLSVFDAQGNPLSTIPVKQRVHGQAINPVKTEQVVFFARRPGVEAYVLNINEQRITHRFQSGDNRHFFGHGTFSKDGQYLYTCENNYAHHSASGQGVIVVRDTTTWQKLSEFPAYGIGTHQIALMPDGKRIVAANGGILTHPDTPRKKLNLDTMKPSLTYIECESGKHLDSYYPQHHQMSIRHLDIAEDDTVGVAMQYQGSKQDIVPLIAFHKGEERLQYAKASTETWRSMKQYTASISLNVKQQVAAVTTPRGNSVSFWDIQTGHLLHRESMTDVAGVTYSNKKNCFVTTTGVGDIFVFASGSMIKADAQHYRIANTRWDNHMSYASA